MKLSIFGYLKKTNNFNVEMELHVLIHFYVGVLCLISLIEASILKRYHEAQSLWIFGIIFSLVCIELSLHERSLKIIKIVTPVSYICMVPLGIYISGSVLTPSILYSFLILLIINLITRGLTRIFYVFVIIFTVISYSLLEFKSTQTINIDIYNKDIYIDWIVFFTTISFIVYKLIQNITSTVTKFADEIKITNDKLYIDSITDALTELYNKRYFTESLSHKLLSVAKNYESIAILLLDIDLFKSYNDHYGHFEGDLCLKRVAKAISRSILRKTDLAFRVGGEEFAILLTQISEDDLKVVANRIHVEIEKENIKHKMSIIKPFITLSIGAIHINSVTNLDPEYIFKLADEALYEAKNTGRNKTVYKFI